MSWMYAALLVVCCMSSLLALDEEKFSCETFDDYATIRRTNARCTYNPDLGDNTVSDITSFAPTI